MPRKWKPFRVGRVRVYLRGRVWYLQFSENGKRRRTRAGPDREAARLLAAQVNVQLETGAPSGLTFERIAVPELRRRWLHHLENVRRTSVRTIRRYRDATEHLLRFVRNVRPVRDVSQFGASHADEFIAFLRGTKVSPNGRGRTKKRLLLDNGLRFILQTCRSMFGFAVRRRLLPPYTENPFAAVETDRIPVENAKPIELFDAEQEAAFVRACDDWQFPLLLTLMMTGLRPGEAVHLLLPDDLDLEEGVLHVRNRPGLGWQVKTRAERDVPLHPVLVQVLGGTVGSRTSGPVFLRRRFILKGETPVLSGMSEADLERELEERAGKREDETGEAISREERLRLAHSVWRDAGTLGPNHVRNEFIKVTKAMGLSHQTSPKMLRHLFATWLQEGNVDWLVRMQLMGHSPGSGKGGGPLGMTVRYTHTRPETKRSHLHAALEDRPAVAAARERLAGTASSVDPGPAPHHPGPPRAAGRSRPGFRSVRRIGWLSGSPARRRRASRGDGG